MEVMAMNTQVNKVNKIVSVKTEIDLMSATGEVRMDNFNKIESLNGTLMFGKNHIGSFSANINQMDGGRLNVNINVSDSLRLKDASIIVDRLVEDIGVLYPVIAE